MTGHVHTYVACADHHHTLGGCKCMATLAEGSRTELIDCPPHCPSHGKPPLSATPAPLYSEESPPLLWEDVHVAEQD